MHSAEHRNEDSIAHLRGKKVLCLGMGESAADLVANISEIAESVVLSVRRHHMFSQRCVGQLPIDALQSRYWHSVSTKRKSEAIRTIWIDIVNVNEKSELRLMAEHILLADDEPGSVVTKTEGIFEAQAKNKLTFNIGGIASIAGRTVIFKSGDMETFDAIVFCTGFEFSIPFLETRPQFKDIRVCHLQMFHPTLRDCVAFIGFVRPQQGGIPLMAELQARYFAQVLKGQRQLPTDLVRWARKDADRWRKEFFATPHVFGLVNGLRYNESLAELVGCRPTQPNPVLEPRRFLLYWFHHIWPCQYRQVGPGTCSDASRWTGAPTLHPRASQPGHVWGMLKSKLLSLLPVADYRKRLPVFDRDMVRYR